eukprot:scaffold7519_cov17-Tisochrysis_lutea.AAC.1
MLDSCSFHSGKGVANPYQWYQGKFKIQQGECPSPEEGSVLGWTGGQICLGASHRPSFGLV